MTDLIFEFAMPIHDSWSPHMTTKDYDQLSAHLNNLSTELRAANIIDFSEEEEKLTFQYSLKFADNNEVQALNREFRGKDKPTNVLSFPNGEIDQNDEGTDIIYLGDIILASETVAQESLDQNKDFHAHLLHLCIHGILHLLGHDHIDDEEAEIMEAIEIKLLQQCGVANPYEV
jgi:probable rRNA maturation factor